MAIADEDFDRALDDLHDNVVSDVAAGISELEHEGRRRANMDPIKRLDAEDRIRARQMPASGLAGMLLGNSVRAVSGQGGGE